MSYPEISRLKCNPNLEDQFLLRQNVIYTDREGEPQKLTLILPWSVDVSNLPDEKLPLLVFVQGSGWTTPNFDFEIPQLAQFAHAGYVVATVGHRDHSKGNPFPAYLQDVKCAIRYLRKNAENYHLDPERVVIWGTSSGGNTALLVALTADDPRYETPEYAGFSDKVNAAVSCFGPTDMEALAEPLKHLPEYAMMAVSLSGSADLATCEAVLKEMSPINHVEEGKEYPPILLLNGTADETVREDQLVSMYHRLLDCGAKAEAYLVEGAVHEGNFWSREVREIILEFLKRNQ
ncbi:MAG: alpha/beta hydrolase [Lachnospiraceae bacterium]|nr:alpha/beta hydrolase [Lachnospiraceae bacterium]